MRRALLAVYLAPWGAITLSAQPARLDAAAAAALVDRGLVTEEWTPRLATILPLMVRGTRLHRRWQINRGPRPGLLNVYVIRRGLGARVLDLPAGADQAIGNCAAAGSPGIVVCDAGFLDSFLDDIGVGPTLARMPEPLERRAQHERALALWVVGHEIGHVVFGDAPSHFVANGMTSEVPTASVGYVRELRADSFFVARVSADEGRAIGAAQLVIDVLNAEIHRKIGEVPQGVGILYDYNNRKAVTYVRRGTHPEFVVRGARVLDIMGRSGSPRLRSLGAMVGPFIRDMRDSTE
jgi:hypothetical protein